MTLADRETSPRHASGTPARRLRGVPLALARLTWLLLTGCALLLFAAGVAAQLAAPHAHTPLLAADVVRDAAGEVVLHPWGGGDVAAAGVLSGDRLLAVNGVPVSRAPDAPPPDLFDAPLGAPIELVVRTGLAEPRPVTLIAGGPQLRPLAPLAIPAGAPPRVQLAIDIAVALLVTTVAALIVRRRSDDPAALLSAATLVVVFVGGLSSPVQTLYGLAPRWVPLLDRWYGVAFVCLLAFLLLFPDGRPAPRASLVLLAGTATWMAAASAITPALFPWRMPPAAELALICLTLAAGIGAQLYRFHRVSGPVERQQTRWVVAGAGAAGLGLALHLAAGRALDGDSYSASLLFATVVYPVVRLLQAALPLTIAAAILQYRLWAIDVVVRRALVYAALSACVVLGYALLIAGLSALVRAQGGALAVLVAATLVALAFEPLRTRLQRASRRLLYGERDEPYLAVRRLGAMLEAAPGAIPQRIVATVAESLKLPYVAVDLGRGDALRAAAEWGERPTPELLHPIALSHQGETIGRLVVAPRRGEDTLSSPDRLLLEELARQASAALRAQLLTAELQRAREALVLAREEERRRIRRDLHDGLGPTLASQTLRLDAAIDLLAERPAQAAELLGAIKARNQALVAEIRRLVYELRPPALDDLGLLGALRAAAGHLRAAAPAISISAAPEPLRQLPAAVEVAAYRIALEAVTNAVHHAAARRCEVRLELAAAGTPGLRVTVADDGRGIAPGAAAGVGLRSMRERAEELGGSLTVEPGGDGGTMVSAWLPIAAPVEEERR